MVSDAAAADAEVAEQTVLILVLMEYGLWLTAGLAGEKLDRS